jgi:hypothetical protein
VAGERRDRHLDDLAVLVLLVGSSPSYLRKTATRCLRCLIAASCSSTGISYLRNPELFGDLGAVVTINDHAVLVHDEGTMTPLV